MVASVRVNSELEDIEKLAKQQCDVFKKVESKKIQIDFILNEINLFREFLLRKNPNVLPSSDVRYRHYVLSILKEFECDGVILGSIIYGRNLITTNL